MLFDDVKLQPQQGWFQSLKCLISEDFSTPAASVFLRAAEKITFIRHSLFLFIRTS
jgi:hypothetical protein